MSRSRLISAATLLAAGASLAAGPNLTFAQSELAKLSASDAAGDDSFGRSVAISGDMALIGAHRNDDACKSDPACNSGSAYVFRSNGKTWIQETKLTPSDAALGDWFGWSVAASGNAVVIGAFNEGNTGGVVPDGPGAAYVFRFDGSTWAEESKLIASDAAIADGFGQSVSIDGDVIVVGAPGDNDSAGSAYIYRFNGTNWAEEQKLVASDASTGDNFGFSVSLSANVAVIGAHLRDGASALNAGSAYVFRFNGSSWIQEATLSASDAAAEDWFGWSVSVSGNVAVVGAKLDDDGEFTSGSAYVYRFDGSNWIEEQKLHASDAAWADWFGQAVTVAGDVILAGAHGDDLGGSKSQSGAAYVFRYNGTQWIEEAKLTASDAALGDQFGISVSVSGETAVIGAHWSDDVGLNSGSGYVFGLMGPK